MVGHSIYVTQSRPFISKSLEIRETLIPKTVALLNVFFFFNHNLGPLGIFSNHMV
jgi:hypothetical protein